MPLSLSGHLTSGSMHVQAHQQGMIGPSSCKLCNAIIVSHVCWRADASELGPAPGPVPGAGLLGDAAEAGEADEEGELQADADTEAVGKSVANSSSPAWLAPASLEDILSCAHRLRISVPNAAKPCVFLQATWRWQTPSPQLQQEPPRHALSHMERPPKSARLQSRQAQRMEIGKHKVLLGPSLWRTV